MQRISKALAQLLGYKLQADQDQIEIFAYSLEVLLGTVFEIFLDHFPGLSAEYTRHYHYLFTRFFLYPFSGRRSTLQHLL